MQLVSYLIGLVLISIVAGVSLAAILVYINPFDSPAFVLPLFYAILFVGFASVLTLIGWTVRRVSRIKKYPLSAKQALRRLEISFRQGLLLASVLVASLILQSYQVLAWWHLLILVGLVGLAEWWLGKK